ncbi:MAG: hypothetical protein IPP72_22025 [Chitinophagaceae bacterium]|nr:hypothetical protein [Chitinophagaceae bacterium]
MKNILITMWSILFVQLGLSQKVEVLKSSGKTNLPLAEDFAFIEPKTDTVNYSFVSTYRVVGKKNEGNVTNLFFLISAQAKKDGANCFKLNSYERNDSLNEATLILDTYFWNDSARLINFNNHEQNCIYIFGSERANDNSSISFKIDNEKKTLRPGTYYKYVRTEGRKVKISKGGITGMTVFYTLEGNKPDIFLTLTGLGLGGMPIPDGMIGTSFNTGRITPIQGDLGCLLKVLLVQSD